MDLDVPKLNLNYLNPFRSNSTSFSFTPSPWRPDLQWVPHYCLTCDKQTDGATYCSESCRLADYEETSSFPYSDPSSPSWSASTTTTTAYPWSTSSFASRKSLSLTPAYDFSNPHPYGTTPGQYHYSHNYSSQYAAPRRPSNTTSALLPSTATAAATATTSVTYHHVLSPSSSHSSLSSMRSSASSGGAVGALTAFASGSNGSHAGFGTSAGSSNGDLSDRARSELRKYASSLEQGKLQRRRSC